MKRKSTTLKLKCFSCPHLFSADFANRVIFCNGEKGRLLDAYADKAELLEDFSSRFAGLVCPLKRGKKIKTWKDEKCVSSRIKNFFKHKDAVDEEEYRQSDTYYLLLNNHCNNNCRFCFLGKKKENPNPSLDALLEKADGIKENTVILFGGEPTLCPHILIVAKRLDGKRKKIFLTTNGRKLSEGKFAKDLLSCRLDQLTVSLHSHKKEDHEFLTRSKGFEETIKGIENASRFKSAQTVFRANIVINKINYRYLLDLAKFARENGFTRIRFNLLSPVFEKQALRMMKPLLIKPLDSVPYLLEAMAYLSESGADFMVSNHPLCYFPPKYWKYFAIDRVALERRSDLGRGRAIATLTEACLGCSVKSRCPGIKGSSLAYFGREIISSLNSQKESRS